MRWELAALGGADIEAARRRLPRAFGWSPAESLGAALTWSLFVGFTGFCLWSFDVTPMRLLSGIGEAGKIIALMFPPTAAGGFGELAGGLAESIAMAFLGTVIATTLAIPIGFLASRNLVPNWILHFGLRRGMDALRGVDQLIWGLVFVRAVGLGPLAGILALAVSDTGTLSKLFSEAIEAIDRRPVEGLRSAGATRLQEIRYAIMPQIVPVILSQSLFFFESNIRSATILGVVGAGGIGLQLMERIRIHAWDQTAFVLLMILVTVSVLDTISRKLRSRLIRG